MSLLRKIQDATVDPNFQLADILRMCKLLAARLDHAAFKEWVHHELNCYSRSEQLPDYRILRNLGCRGDFFGSFGSGIKNAPIPLMSLPEDSRELVSTRYIFQSVSSLESTVRGAEQNGTSVLRVLWPADVVAFLGSDIYEYMICGQAWTDVPTAAFVAILDTVKSRILDFVLEIEAQNFDVGNAESNNLIPDEVTSNIFNNCILHQHYQAASSGAIIQTYSQGKTTMSEEKYVNNLQHSNIANMANKVTDQAKQQANQYIYQSEHQKTLAEAASEIQQLLRRLEQINLMAAESEQISYINDETTPGFKRRVVNALRASSEAAIDEFISENKYLKVVKAAIKSWFEQGT